MVMEKEHQELSVDHIDQDPLNNCFNNLRIVDRKTQEQNTKGIKEEYKKRTQTIMRKPLPRRINTRNDEKICWFIIMNVIIKKKIYIENFSKLKNIQN